MLSRVLPAEGEVLAGKYRLVRRLGEGGMGIVFEALHLRIQQRVAIKMLLPEVLDIPDVVSRFEREARAAGQLRSDNTARVLDVDVSEGGLPYMVMEFLDGSDLGKILETQGALPITDAVDYVLQTCNAMTEAHAAGIIHRDLKPSNLFVCGADRKVKVLDFGISKLENDAEARVTATQTVVGTPLYMSPEQVRSSKHVDSRTDIWSLGIILYELISGRTPFEGSTTAAAAAICIDEPPPLSNFRQGVPPELEAVIRTALQKDVNLRYPTVQSLALAIVRFGSGQVRGPDTVPTAIPLPSHPSLPRISNHIGQDRTLPHSDASQPRANATTPGWTTRSGPPKRKSALLIVAMGGLAVAGVAAVTLPKLLSHSTRTPLASDTTTSPKLSPSPPDTTPTAAPAAPSASVSVEPAVPSASVIHHPAGPAATVRPRHQPTGAPPTTTAAPTPASTHAAPAPTRL
jgi:serine/threonine protein kinase